jgi:hypothetical protein
MLRRSAPPRANSTSTDAKNAAGSGITTRTVDHAHNGLSHNAVSDAEWRARENKNFSDRAEPCIPCAIVDVRSP